MIKCRLINTTQPLHVSKHTDERYCVFATSFYLEKLKECGENNYFEAVFRMDPIITPTKEFEDFIILKLHTPGISPTPGLLSLDYDMIEDFLKDWQILEIYDIFEHPEQLNPKASWRKEIESKSVVDINYKEI